MINVGDIVKVKDWGESYSYSTEWFLMNNIDIQLMIRYAYGDGRKYDEYNDETGFKDNLKYKVLAVADGKALITENNEYDKYDNSPAYVIGVNALINIKEIHRMTIEEIEEALGYPIEIIE